MRGAETKAADRRLKTWKEIASFFGCDERTVKRWEEARGLPVRRLPNGSRSAVFAYESELRAWLDRHPDPIEAAPEAPLAPRPPRRPPRALPIAGGVGFLLLVLGIAAVLTRGPIGLPGIATGNHHAPNAEAERFYRAGLYAWQTRTPVGLTRAVDDFTQAIVRDPQYAKAYAGLADCYNLLRAYTAMPDAYAFPRAKAAAERAIALDPSLADAHAALAFVQFSWLHDAASAVREYRTAIRLDPRNATSHHWYAVVLMTMRRFREALAEIDKAQQIDSASAPIVAAKGLILFLSGRTAEAADLLRQVEQTEPRLASPHLWLAAMARQNGDDAAFVREFSAYAACTRQPGDIAIATAAARGIKAGGHKAMLLAMLAAERQLWSQEQGSAYSLAQIYAQLGNAPEALRYLKLSFERHESDAVSLNVQPEFRGLRNLPAFRQLVRQAGLEPSGS